jgi:hypothetical protein
VRPVPSLSSLLPVTRYVTVIPTLWNCPVSLPVNITMRASYPFAFDPYISRARRYRSYITRRFRPGTHHQIRWATTGKEKKGIEKNTSCENYIFHKNSFYMDCQTPRSFNEKISMGKLNIF